MTQSLYQEDTKLRTVTLDQPRASLVATSAKLVETRSWAPPGNVINQEIGLTTSLTISTKPMPPNPKQHQDPAGTTS